MTRAIILSASAGSGKTYQLALKYVCDVVRHPEKFRNILAVTFTNKATEEMKSRIYLYANWKVFPEPALALNILARFIVGILFYSHNTCRPRYPLLA